jgi:hypothetical protein
MKPFALLAAALLLLASNTAADEPQTADSMHLTISADHVDFVAGNDVLAGRYHHGDPFKPFIHPLNSPQGHCVSLARPHDHRHQKGLMYALRTPDLNFWEEVSTLPGERVGRERHLVFSDLRESGREIGFTETISWEPAEGGEAVFDETRRVACQRKGAAFVWTWETTMRVRRDTRLIQSQWSNTSPDGRKTNYHGLGLRMCRAFGGPTRNNALQIDDGPIQWNRNSQPFDFTTAMGLTPARVTFIGHIDGTWPAPRIGVTMTQQQKNGLFVFDTPYALMSLGPSNLAEIPLATGAVLHERYTVTVEDLSTEKTR